MGKSLNMKEYNRLYDRYSLELERLAAKLRSTLPIKHVPNVYDWQGIKEFFSKFCEIQFNVPINQTPFNNNNDAFKESNVRPCLWYNLEEKDGRKIIQFNIPEPSDEDDLKIIFYSSVSSNYMEVLKTLFFEYISIAELPFEIPEQLKDNKEFNCKFMLEMLISEEEYFHASFMFTTNSKLDRQKMADYFHLTWDVIEGRRNKFVYQGKIQIS